MSDMSYSIKYTCPKCNAVVETGTLHDCPVPDLESFYRWTFSYQSTQELEVLLRIEKKLERLINILEWMKRV